ncbi:PAN domain-containing protein [Oceanicaulis sp. LC35]|uniref:PAN domain-containing protein n=1 Tax=Oceanicaulis sp. LC35 TaxID=3349635 RepID=UPI003F868D4A
MIAVFALMLQTAAPDPTALPPGALTPDHARRGVLIRLDGAAAQSVEACISACALNEPCQAWTWRPTQIGRAARCELHPIAGPSQYAPGAVTGLSPELAARIEAGAERAPSARERAALTPQPRQADTPYHAENELAGGG